MTKMTKNKNDRRRLPFFSISDLNKNHKQCVYVAIRVPFQSYIIITFETNADNTNKIIT